MYLLVMYLLLKAVKTHFPSCSLLFKHPALEDSESNGLVIHGVLAHSQGLQSKHSWKPFWDNFWELLQFSLMWFWVFEMERAKVGE